MAKIKMTDLQKLAYDALKGNVKGYSLSEADEAIRQALEEAVGGELNYYNYMDNKGKFFSVIQELIQITTPDFADFFSQFVDFHDVALGDRKEFIVNDDKLFRVATIASGTNDLRRQKIYNSKVTIDTDTLGLKIYTDLELFLAGRIPWSDYILRVRRSMEREIASMIYQAIYDSYDLLVSPYQISGVFSETALRTGIAHVKAESGTNPVVYGTPAVLSQITSTVVSELAKEDIYYMGHYGIFEGTEVRELPQWHVNDTNTFAVNDQFLLIVPDGESFVKVVFEGEPLILETNDPNHRTDMQLEFLFTRKVGVGVLVPVNFAIYRITP